MPFNINYYAYQEDDGPDNMTDGDAETYWESDGNQGQHWIRLTMKKGTIIKYDINIFAILYNLNLFIDKIFSKITQLITT